MKKVQKEIHKTIEFTTIHPLLYDKLKLQLKLEFIEFFIKEFHKFGKILDVLPNYIPTLMIAGSIAREVYLATQQQERIPFIVPTDIDLICFSNRDALLDILAQMQIGKDRLVKSYFISEYIPGLCVVRCMDNKKNSISIDIKLSEVTNSTQGNKDYQRLIRDNEYLRYLHRQYAQLKSTKTALEYRYHVQREAIFNKSERLFKKINTILHHWLTLDANLRFEKRSNIFLDPEKKIIYLPNIDSKRCLDQNIIEFIQDPNKVFENNPIMILRVLASFSAEDIMQTKISNATGGVRKKIYVDKKIHKSIWKSKYLLNIHAKINPEYFINQLIKYLSRESSDIYFDNFIKYELFDSFFSSISDPPLPALELHTEVVAWLRNQIMQLNHKKFSESSLGMQPLKFKNKFQKNYPILSLIIHAYTLICAQYNEKINDTFYKVLNVNSFFGLIHPNHLSKKCRDQQFNLLLQRYREKNKANVSITDSKYNKKTKRIKEETTFEFTPSYWTVILNEYKKNKKQIVDTQSIIENKTNIKNQSIIRDQQKLKQKRRNEKTQQYIQKLVLAINTGNINDILILKKNLHGIKHFTHQNFSGTPFDFVLQQYDKDKLTHDKWFLMAYLLAKYRNKNSFDKEKLELLLTPIINELIMKDSIDYPELGKLTLKNLEDQFKELNIKLIRIELENQMIQKQFVENKVTNKQEKLIKNSNKSSKLGDSKNKKPIFIIRRKRNKPEINLETSPLLKAIKLKDNFDNIKEILEIKGNSKLLRENSYFYLSELLDADIEILDKIKVGNLLVDFGLNTNALNTEYRTKLLEAIKLEHISKIKILLNIKGINVNLGSPKHKITPLHGAVFRGMPEVVKLLVDAKADVLASDGCFQPLERAIHTKNMIGDSKDHSDIIEYLQQLQHYQSTTQSVVKSEAPSMSPIYDIFRLDGVPFNIISPNGNKIPFLNINFSKSEKKVEKIVELKIFLMKLAVSNRNIQPSSLKKNQIYFLEHQNFVVLVICLEIINSGKSELLLSKPFKIILGDKFNIAKITIMLSCINDIFHLTMNPTKYFKKINYRISGSRMFTEYSYKVDNNFKFQLDNLPPPIGITQKNDLATRL